MPNKNADVSIAPLGVGGSTQTFSIGYDKAASTVDIRSVMRMLRSVHNLTRIEGPFFIDYVTDVLPSSPGIKGLLNKHTFNALRKNALHELRKYSKIRQRKKRMRKKFDKDPRRYVSARIFDAWCTVDIETDIEASHCLMKRKGADIINVNA